MPVRNIENPPPGFPRKEKFKSGKEIDRYFAGEKIQCLICGKWFKTISHFHLTKVHGISTDDYKEMFGLPWGRGLLGTRSFEIYAENARKLRAEGKLRTPSKENQKFAKPREKPLQPFEKDSRARRFLAIHGKTRKYCSKDYEKVLERMRDENRTLTDVCGDTDMVSLTAMNDYLKKHPDMKKQLHKIERGLTYTLQARSHNLSPRFRIVCQRMRGRGESTKKIASALGASSYTVRRILKEASPDSPTLKRIIDPIKWKLADYEAIFDRMRDQRRTLTDLCKDPDLPSFYSLNDFRRKNPEINNKIREIQQGLPYNLQLRCRILSPRFTIDCLRLRSIGMSNNKIARALGCSLKPVTRVFRDNPDSGAPRRFNQVIKWPREAFESILVRMRRQQRTLNDVCSDDDLPSHSSWCTYKKEHPEIVIKYKQILWSLSIHVQLKTRTVSPEIIARCKDMLERGMTQLEIAREFGVSLTAVKRLVRNTRKNKSKA